MKINLVNPDIRDNYLINLLHARGVEDIEEFLNPTSASLQSWRDLENIREGLNLLRKTIETKGNILIVVDCDVDGFTSAAIIYLYI